MVENTEVADPWSLKTYDVPDILGKAFLFFEAQESGHLRDCHRVQWRGNSYSHDGHTMGKDLSGGWFDAGDHLKLTFPLCWTITQLAWSVHTGQQTLQSNFQGKANIHWALQTLKHGAEYLLACHTAPDELVMQVGEVDRDHENCFKPEQDITTPRTVYKITSTSPGADAAAAAAAALAATSVALSHHPEEAVLQATCLEHALQLYSFGRGYPGCYSTSVPECKKTYPSEHWEQHMFLAASWLAVATRDRGKETGLELTRPAASDSDFLGDAERWQDASDSRGWWPEYSWCQVYFGACAVMWDLTRLERYGNKLQEFCTSHYECKHGVKRTPCGLTFLSKWGSCRHAAGVAGIMAFYGSTIKETHPQESKAAIAFAERQLCYILGAGGHSWVIGCGDNPPQRPHHRGSALTEDQSGDWNTFNTAQDNPNQLIGGLVGGPDEDGNWVDDRTDYVACEVAIDYNAAFVLALVQCSTSLSI